MERAAPDVRVTGEVRLGVALVAENVSFFYAPARPVLAGLNVRFEAGRVTAVLGPNGAGKSTLLRILCGLRVAQAGAVLLGAESVPSMPARVRAERIVYVPQKSEVAFDYTAADVVSMGAFGRRVVAATAEAALARVGLEDRSRDLFRTLSAGQQQRVAIARALAQIGPPRSEHERFVLADEPVSAMDPPHALATMNTLKELARDGLGVAMVLHDLSLALRFADDVVLLDVDGAVHARGECAATLTPESLRSVFGLGFEALRDSGGRVAAFVPEAVSR